MTTVPLSRGLPAHRRSRARTLTALVLVFVLSGVVACQPAITVLEPATGESPLAAATVTPADHGLSVVAVDFDPSLEYSQIVASGGITLLAAITNNGRAPETNVEVTAVLQDTAGRRQVDLLRETQTVRQLDPGAVEVVRFSQVTGLPIRPSYKLIVSVAPAPGETDLEDNVRTYDILVDQTR